MVYQLTPCRKDVFFSTPQQNYHPRRSTPTICNCTDFHQSRLSATTTQKPATESLNVTIRNAHRDDELEAAAWLRAKSFYAYPPERKFAGEIHQIMVAEEEFKDLKSQRLNRILAKSKKEEDAQQERSETLIAVCQASDLGIENIDEILENEEFQHISEWRRLLLNDGDDWKILVGSLDVYAVRAMPGEVLIGSCQNPAYLANVCAANIARRRGVGESLLRAARETAAAWNVDGLYVHTMAVNEIAMRFYERNGFLKEKEETSNQAHYRGRCLDGIEGRGRTVLLKDSRY